MGWDIVEDVGIVAGVLVGTAVLGDPLKEKLSGVRHKTIGSAAKMKADLEAKHPSLKPATTKAASSST